MLKSNFLNFFHKFHFSLIFCFLPWRVLCTKACNFPSFHEHHSLNSVSSVTLNHSQQALNDYGAIMWVGRETEEFFITGEINAAIAQAQQSGIVAWTLETGDATSTLTH